MLSCCKYSAYLMQLLGLKMNSLLQICEGVFICSSFSKSIQPESVALYVCFFPFCLVVCYHFYKLHVSCEKIFFNPI